MRVVGPKDIPESVAQASAAAGKVAVTFAASELTREPEIARINEPTCAVCLACMRACPYHAIDKAEIRARNGADQVQRARQPGVVRGLRDLRGGLPVQAPIWRDITEQEIYAMVEALA